MGDINLIQLLSNLGSTGILVWIVVKSLPQAIAVAANTTDTLVKAFKEELRYEREQCLSLHRENQGKIDKIMERLSIRPPSPGA